MSNEKWVEYENYSHGWIFADMIQIWPVQISVCMRLQQCDSESGVEP